MAARKTSVQLTYQEDKESKPLRSTYGLRQVLSAGARLFLRLSSDEREQLVCEVMEAEEKNSGRYAQEKAAELVWELLPPNAQEAAIAAVRGEEDLDLMGLVGAIRHAHGKQATKAMKARRRSTGRRQANSRTG